jgi:hypothetical protein
LAQKLLRGSVRNRSEDDIEEKDDLIPKVRAQEEFDSSGIVNIVAQQEINCRKFTLWDQLGDRAKEILLKAPMNK